jgi:hypothetical protein
MWNTLQQMAIPEHLIELMRNLYEGQVAVVRTEVRGKVRWTASE